METANSAAMLRVLIFLVSLGARAIRAMCRCRADLVIENLALRQQVTALKKERPRPPLEDTDRAFRSSVASVGEPARYRERRHGRPVESRSVPPILGSDLPSALSGVDLGLMPRFVVSSARWPKTAGVHLVSTLS